MYLKKIEMQGFKSFADRITIELGTGVTSIVGPNGSGKSNISDAVRWVLGEQSVKSLRGSKMEDVIFSGTERRKPSGYAEVTLLFDNDGGGLPVPYAEVSVTRRTYRSGESEYLINRGRCRLRDVNELFFDTGVGREGYTIIGQGKVDEILNDKPEERRGIFEEAAGIMKYKMRRVEAERKLEATAQNLLRIRDVATGLAEQMDALGEQEKTARRYLKLRDELRGIEVAGYVAAMAKAGTELKSCEAGREAANGEYGRQTELLHGYQAAAEERDRRLLMIDSLQAEAHGAVREIEARMSDTANTISLNAEKSERAAADIERVQGEIANAGERRVGQEAELSAGKTKFGYLSGELARYDGLLNAKKAEYEAVLALLGESDRAIEALKREAANTQERWYDGNNALARLSAERAHVDKTVAAIEKNIALAATEIDAASFTIEDLSGRRSELASRAAELRGTIKELAEHRQKQAAELDRRGRELSAKRSELDAKRTRIRLLSDMENSFEGFYQSVRRVLLEAARSPEFGRGICGAVAGILDVPKKLELAVSMALGSAQQNIVTEDEAAAKRAIAFLKRTSGGRATFMPLTSVKGRTLDQARRLFGKPGFIGIASELVGYDAKYERAVRELLGRTAVADTLDNAVRLASEFGYSFRIVTLEGDILNTGGSITGGSVEARESSILSRHREIPELKKAVTAAEAEFTGLIGEREAFARGLADTDARAERAGREENERRVEEAALLTRLSHAEQKLETDKERRELLRVELGEAKRGGVELDASLGELRRAGEELAAAAEKMQATIGEYTEKNREGQKSRDDLLADISDYNVSVASIAEAHKAVGENINRLEAELAEGDRGVAAREAAIARHTREIERLRLESEARHYDLDNMEVEKRGRLLKIESVTAERGALRDEARTLAEEAARANERLQDIQRELSRFEAREARLRAELANSRDRLWEDYELTYDDALASLRGSAEQEMPTPDGQNPETHAAGGQKPPEEDGAAARRAAKLREEIKSLGYVNVLAIDEFAQTKSRLLNIDRQIEDMEGADEKLRKVIGEMSAVMRRNFLSQFELINRNFDLVFRELFSGGHGRLILTEGRDVLEAGVEIEIQLPGKRMQNMLLYSGGERALTAIALIFAMLTLKPVPFCLLDEIESALDEANVERFSRYIRKYCDTTQFIMVTHRKGTMEGSNALYGVTMQERGVSGVVALRLSEAVV